VLSAVVSTIKITPSEQLCWDEDGKNKLARLYERYVDTRSCSTKADDCARFQAEMWSKIAEEMTVPWRAAEAMHWQIGEQDMARRAGITAFSLSSNQNLQTARPPPSDFQHNHAAPQAEIPQLPSVAELAAGVPANFQLRTRPIAGAHWSTGMKTTRQP